MADLKYQCAECGAQWARRIPTCSCGVPFLDRPELLIDLTAPPPPPPPAPAPEPEPAPTPPPSADAPGPGPAGAGAGSSRQCDRCGTAVDAGRTRCSRCTALHGAEPVRARPVAIRAIWGLVDLGPGTLELGRGDSPLSTRLAKFSDISRRHARLDRDDASGAVTITDLNSLNGTFVNGEQLQIATPRTLLIGDTISLGGAIELDVEEAP